MSVTIDQIAKEAGVSVSTVARVLRGDTKGAHQRSAERAKRILEISEQLGYRPNWRARSLARGKTHTIGLLYSNPKWIFEDPMNEIGISFTEALQEQNYDLRLVPVSDNSDWKSLVFGSGVDGLAFLLHVPEAAEEVVRESRLPLILLGDKFADAPHVVPDDVSGGYTATRHLLGLGHKRIAFYIDESIRQHVSVDERRAGYEHAMKEAGHGDAIQVLRAGVSDVISRLSTPDRPSAVVCYCHIEALRLTHAAWSHGISVPTDLSLIAFNDMAMTRYMTPPLTVVGFDTAEMGRLGARRLVSQIEGADEAELERSVTLRHQLTVRGTTAPPRSG